METPIFRTLALALILTVAPLGLTFPLAHADGDQVGNVGENAHADPQSAATDSSTAATAGVEGIQCRVCQAYLSPSRITDNPKAAMGKTEAPSPQKTGS